MVQQNILFLLKDSPNLGYFATLPYLPTLRELNHFLPFRDRSQRLIGDDFSQIGRSLIHHLGHRRFENGRFGVKVVIERPFGNALSFDDVID